MYTYICTSKKTQNYSQMCISKSNTALNEEMTVKRLHTELGDLLDSLRRVVEKYPILATPEVYASVQLLVSYVQSK